MVSLMIEGVRLSIFLKARTYKGREKRPSLSDTLYLSALHIYQPVL